MQISPFSRMHQPEEGAVHWTEGFWGQRFRQCHAVTIPYVWDVARDEERCVSWSQLRIAAGLAEGQEGESAIHDEHGSVVVNNAQNRFKGSRWNDEFIYKLLQAMAHTYAVTKDPALDRSMDEMVEVIERAQRADGYIATQTQLTGLPRFEKGGMHELYVMGHLISAACVHYRATGKRKMLDIAEKCADYLYVTFMPRDPALANISHNPTCVMACVELYRVTGRKKYLELANCFLDLHGSAPGGTDLTQTAVPVRMEEHIVGHGVFFGYLYAGAADIAMETGDPTLINAIQRLWADLYEKKSYIHAGATPIRKGTSIRNHFVCEAAGRDYELPNTSAHNETCANIAGMMWSYRMLSLTGQGQYADRMENAIYNSIISGIGVEGHSWNYVNPLRWWGAEQEYLFNDWPKRLDPGKGTQICCTSNLLRTIAGLHNSAYSQSGDSVWVNLYGSNKFSTQLQSGKWSIEQITDYPWNGEIRFIIHEAPAKEVSFFMRIPHWAHQCSIKVNKIEISDMMQSGEYYELRRVWKKGEELILYLEMPVRLMKGHYKIEETRGQVAVMRGPVLYCLESRDLPDGIHMWEVFLPGNVQFAARNCPDLLGGVTVLEGMAKYIPQQGGTSLYQEWNRYSGTDLPVRLIPYYSWNNRGETEMTVWLPLV